MAVQCPTLEDILNADQCTENLAGLGSVIYAGLKSDLSAPMTATDNEYTEPTFKPSTGLIKIECAEETQGITGSSLKGRKGFKQTLEMAIDSVNKLVAKNTRGLNNLDLFFIVPDGDEFQIMYSPNRRITVEDGGIQTNTGKAASDERQTTCTFVLQPVLYPNYYVKITDISKLLKTKPVEEP